MTTAITARDTPRHEGGPAVGTTGGEALVRAAAPGMAGVAARADGRIARAPGRLEPPAEAEALFVAHAARHAPQGTGVVPDRDRPEAIVARSVTHHPPLAG